MGVYSEWVGGGCGMQEPGMLPGMVTMVSSWGAGRSEKRKTHFCTFIAQHLLCTDILRPSQAIPPPPPAFRFPPAKSPPTKTDSRKGDAAGICGRGR